MPRKLPNWLDSYVEYTKETESAPIFHKWIGLSMIASALRKKTFLQLGRIKVFPNLYIVIVAEPGIARKSQAIAYGVDIMSEIDHLVMSADAITREALLDDLEASATVEQMTDGSEFTHSSLSIVSKEFESFLGQKKENTRMLVMLTDLYDAQELPWRYRTKRSGTNIIPSVFLSILAATTPESLASSLPSIAIGGGLTSRIIFVWAAKGGKKQPIPKFTVEMAETRNLLIRDLSVISRIIGKYVFDTTAKEKWISWYMKYEPKAKKRICKDPAFNGWYTRKPMFLLKMSMCLAAAESQKKVIYWDKIQYAIELLEEAEYAMGRTFSAVGRSEITAEVDLVKNIIQSHKVIEEKILMQMCWRDIDSTKFDNVIATAMRSGEVVRRFKGPAKAKGIWYFWSGTLAEQMRNIEKVAKSIAVSDPKKLADTVINFCLVEEATDGEIV